MTALSSRSSMECQVPHIADFKSACISLIIDPRDLTCETIGNHGLRIL